MDDDVNPTIRPVLPSRQNTQPPSGAVLGLNQMCPICGGAHTQAEHGHPLPPEPKKEKTVKKPSRRTMLEVKRINKAAAKNRHKDPRRSAAARAAWASRRTSAKQPPTDTSALAKAVAALMKLDRGQQDLALQIARSVVL
jgi:hypothetical protein